MKLIKKDGDCHEISKDILINREIDAFISDFLEEMYEVEKVLLQNEGCRILKTIDRYPEGFYRDQARLEASQYLNRPYADLDGSGSRLLYDYIFQSTRSDLNKDGVPIPLYPDAQKLPKGIARARGECEGWGSIDILSAGPNMDPIIIALTYTDSCDNNFSRDVVGAKPDGCNKFKIGDDLYKVKSITVRGNTVTTTLTVADNNDLD